MRTRGFVVLTAVIPLWVGLYSWARGLNLNQIEWFEPLNPGIQYLQAGGWVALLATILGLGLLAFDFVLWLRKRIHD
jgi:hypothetical protein